jgi:hypothetical protein
MGTYEQPHFVATAQYLSATDNPFIARDVQRRGLSFFGELREGSIGWAGVAGVDLYDLDTANEDGDSRRRYLFGGAHWSQVGRGRLGIIVSLEQVNGGYGGGGSQLLERRLLGQTHVEF